MLFSVVLLVTATCTAAKPVFDGTFGANCPPCREFGTTVLKKLYAAEGIADAVDFEMHSAIRSPGDPSTDHTWACPDEDDGCPMTKWFICAVDGWNKTTTTQDQRVNFLTCWDDSKGTLEARTKSCADAVGFDMNRIKQCQRGDEGERLQMNAAKTFETKFPAHAHSGIFEVPHLFIGGKEVGENGRDYTAILQSLCAMGIDANACKNITTAGGEAPPDPCLGVDCGAHGSCISGKCVCSSGYTGEHCETKTKPCCSTSGNGGCGCSISHRYCDYCDRYDCSC